MQQKTKVGMHDIYQTTKNYWPDNGKFYVVNDQPIKRADNTQLNAFIGLTSKGATHYDTVADSMLL